MTADLPTEEDVLAVLVLWACRPIMTNVSDAAQCQERNAYDAAIERREIGFSPVGQIALARVSALGMEPAIADSERRLQMERARDTVVDAAVQWFRDFEHCLPGVIPISATDKALWYHVRALQAVEAVR